MEYTNRYGDVYTFTKQEDGSVLWEGSFEHCRFGWPNIYKKAYQQYCKDVGSKGGHPMFIDKAIDMIDPSGGPYLSTHTNLYERFGDDELKGLCISSFEPIETGYKIYTYGEFDHLADTKIIGGIINTSEK
jgi:hypothetical protein